MTDTPQEKRAPWLTTMAEHEGFPLALRVRPEADTPEHRVSFHTLAVLTHKLAAVKPNGLPEADYNRSLAEFDADVHEVIEREGDGLVVLVETFAGERNYYAYVADGPRATTRIAELRARHPQHALELQIKEDPHWRFYNKYRRDFPW